MNTPSRTTVIPVTEASQVGEARRTACQLATELKFDETLVGRVAIIATELATNLCRHGKRGSLIVQPIHGERWRPYAVELISTDSGPGMPDVDRCMADGYSTAGTAGQGLGAVRRLATEFDIHSTVDAGTVVVARIMPAPAPTNPMVKLRYGAVTTPAPGERVCGDQWRAMANDHRLSIVVADGLGHGPLAYEAADLACSKLELDSGSSPAAMIQSMHQALGRTRGAAVAIATVDVGRRNVRYAAVGNIAANISTRGQSRGLVTHNGIVGKQMRTVQEFEYEWPAKGLLIMHSDGLQSRWSFDRYPGLMAKHPSLIAATLARDFSRGRDDLSVIVVSSAEGI